MSADDLARIQHAARYGRIILTGHAQEEAENAKAQARDIENAIRTATVADLQEQSKFRLEGGVGLDGEPLGVVVREIQPGLLVITVF
jgi:hypothetical protein